MEEGFLVILYMHFMVLICLLLVIKKFASSSIFTEIYWKPVLLIYLTFSPSSAIV